ncbi:signal recognition particle subunit SRP54 [Caldicoprobacter guelmensis]|uniref:signal recognition particle protein n=1 Tax=Caldicoprobacter guelmensis TaxID=1170224 RepID=UPI00195BC8F2|nr:signal recognition particle protein [Caldicoprobacter guelmensis]MBM7581233.1 signal recognition particle subunit SRP54 [Caldicoprobacter guelmensis]
MAFEGLTGKLQAALKKLTGKGKLSEKDVKEAMRDVRLALLEADVNFVVVKDLIKRITERAVGQEIMQSLTPGQQVIKIVNEELTALMGGTQSKVNMAPNPPTVIMMVGLQGSGKTTTAGKLAGYFKKQGKNPLLVACDIYRPAAIKQLQVVGQKVGVPVFERGQIDPVQIAREAVEFAKKEQRDVVIIDTAGRLHINEELMEELSRIKSQVKPHEILLVVDAMTGQDAVNVAKSFDERLGLDGVILTKLDGDTRGGAALSIKAVTGKPIKFVGTGEKLDDLEPFHPDRMASRILGMGDILTLIEKAQASIDEKKAQELEKKLREQQFTLEDFLDQLQQIKKMGSLTDIIGMLPGVDVQKLSAAGALNEKELIKAEAIIQSMTREERRNPSIINASRKKRIAMGSGTTIQDVNRLLKSFEQFRQMMKQMSNIEKAMKRGRFRFPFL